MESSKAAASGAGGFTGNGSILCVPELVQRHAAVIPDAIALQAGADRLSYRELNSRSNRLAHYLREMGVAAGSVVGLSVERNLNFPVAALAIMKVGCAYLPIEIKTPERRLQMMLNAARVAVVVTNGRLEQTVNGDGRKIVALDTRAAEISRSSSDPLDIRIAREQLAYVIYTSGSTGSAKAVAVGHDSLLNLILWHNRTFSVTANDRATQLASIGFDAAVWELWPNMVAGASVHFVDDETRTHPEQFRDFLVREQITISFAPTPLAERMLKLDWKSETSLRFLLTGADTLHHFPPAHLPFALVNNYGPTECAVVATSATIAAEGNGKQRPSIGRAIDNTEIYVLTNEMERVSGEDLGEIYIGGAGLAKGYLNDAALTAERFVNNPFREGERLYRTGDLGCYLPDGQIAFHGRVDDQVKIRGYRIELDEVISALSRHPSIRENVVVASGNQTGEKQLVAYVAPVTALPAVSELRDFMAKELPEYMIPATFVQVDSLPLGSNGKVDRSALPAPSEENILREETFLSPRSATEERVAAIVARLLGLPKVGVNDNFFYLGGNSLFGTQVISRLRDAFNVEVPLLKLFDHPTVADLAGEVERLMVARLDAMSEEEAQRLLASHTAQASV